uniref:Uncharacterized protein n=1 Tax=Arundo donax TaxID=35708 RepID=A0A0A9GTG7_ARUDO
MIEKHHIKRLHSTERSGSSPSSIAAACSSVSALNDQLTTKRLGSEKWMSSSDSILAIKKGMQTSCLPTLM